MQRHPVHFVGDSVGGHLVQHGDDPIQDRRGVDPVLRRELVVEEMLDVAEHVVFHGLLGGPGAHGSGQQDEIP